ncbi:NAD(P)/FAD-dependent oxidoreductase [Aquabacterium sp. J223]|uniref:NAD(P)/FAD-dependent oxidoreductase n=1 Tax=Aquabacterium sp. J223 TaxID=2898431 RepID=UPI002897A0DA|nr:NAD(P)/FAD-dependent oxidoreductase [Aquabacterium sp. J223]
MRSPFFERDDRLGGMSAHTVIDGTAVERYYHFVCRPDLTTFRYLNDLGLQHKLHWRTTRMGFYSGGRLHDWGHPMALLRFPGLGLVDKARYAAHVLWAGRIRDWRPYDRFTSTEWLQRWIGPRAYDVLWRSLFHHKFYQHQDRLSAAWLGARIQRVARSRASWFEERLGYLEGGSMVLLQALADRLRGAGGKIRLSSGVDEVLADGVRVRGVQVGGFAESFDQVVTTVPLPLLPRLVPQLPANERRKIEAIVNVGVVCVLLKLKRRFSPNFWTNVNDPRFEIPGLIEYTNLNPLDGSHIVYVPFYMPQDHDKFGRDDHAFLDESVACLEAIQPGFSRADVKACAVSRYRYAQTVCTPGFYDALPPMASALHGLFLADTSHYYPEDRSMSESLRVGAALAGLAAAAR